MIQGYPGILYISGYRDIQGYYIYQDTGISRDIIYIRIQGYPGILYISGYRDIQGYYKYQDTGIFRDNIKNHDTGISKDII